MPPKYTRKRCIQAHMPVGPSIAYIPLTRGFWSLIDAEDAERAQSLQWRAKVTREGQTPYAVRQDIGMHRFIIGTNAQCVDHRNGNSLDNRKCNLREATRSQNQHNRPKSRNNTSGLKGVTCVPDRNAWRCDIMVGGTKRFLGYFRSAEEAGHAYRNAAIELQGDFAHASEPPSA